MQIQIIIVNFAPMLNLLKKILKAVWLIFGILIGVSLIVAFLAMLFTY